MTADAGQIHPTTNQEEPRKSDLAKICQSWERLLHHYGEPFDFKPFQTITDLNAAMIFSTPFRDSACQGWGTGIGDEEKGWPDIQFGARGGLAVAGKQQVQMPGRSKDAATLSVTYACQRFSPPREELNAISSAAIELNI